MESSVPEFAYLEGDHTSFSSRPEQIIKPHNPPNRAFILDLPDEILHQILELSCFEDGSTAYLYFDTPYSCELPFSLANVCKRFYYNMTPLLYRHLTIQMHGDMDAVNDESKPLRLLHRTLQEKPGLGRHCQELWVVIREFRSGEMLSIDDFAMAANITRNFVNLKNFLVNGGFEEEVRSDTWKFIRLALLQMPSIQNLHLGSYGKSGPDLCSVVRYVQSESLRTFEINGTSSVYDDLELWKNFPPTTIQRLSISSYEESPDAMLFLLRWTTSLTEFRFENHYRNPHYMDWSTFRAVLSSHKDSLVSLHIGYLSQQVRGIMLDISDFTALENLTLSAYQWRDTLTEAPRDAHLLLPPKLKRFTWDFKIDDVHSASYGDFGEPQEKWLRCFAKSAMTKKSALREVHIRFCPETPTEARESMEYPWDRIERLKDEFASKCISFTYTTPTISKEDWLSRLRNPPDSVSHLSRGQ